MNWTLWRQSTDRYMDYPTRAAAVSARVDLLFTWRDSGRGRTTTKRHVPGREGAWTEVDGYDLKEHARIVDFVNVFPTRDR